MGYKPTIPAKTNAVLLDSLCDAIASSMATRLTWLNNTYGKAEKITEEKKAGTLTYPSIYYGGNLNKEYLKMIPDTKLGNFCFCYCGEKQKVNQMGPNVIIDTVIGLIFWYDITKIYTGDHVNRTTENVKNDIIQALRYSITNVKIDRGNIEIVEGINEVYKEFKIKTRDYELVKPIDGMRPKGLLRFNLPVTFTTTC